MWRGQAGFPRTAPSPNIARISGTCCRCRWSLSRQMLPGAQPDSTGVNFAIFSRDAVAVELCLYTDGDAEPLQVIRLDPRQNRTFYFWHVYVEGAQPGLRYTWRVAHAGQDLDAAPELLDPWARAVDDDHWNRRATMVGELGHALRAIVTTRDERD